MVNKTVTPEETGEYFFGKTKRKATCSANPYPCRRVNIPSTGREDCAQKCINNTAEVREALNGRQCQAFNFETDSGFCEVLDSDYWSGQQHGLGKRYTARKKTDMTVLREPPTDPTDCFARVYEYSDYDHWNADATENKVLTDWEKNRSGSIQVKNCANKKAVSFWDENETNAFLLSDGDNKKLDAYESGNKVAVVKFHDIPTANTETEIQYNMGIHGLIDSKMSKDTAVLVNKTRKDLIPITAEFKGDPCPGGEMHWLSPQEVRCIYKKEGLDTKLKSLDLTVNSETEPSSSGRKMMWETITGTYCEDVTNNFNKIVGKRVGQDGIDVDLRCRDLGNTQEKTREYCQLEEGRHLVDDPTTCSIEVLGQQNYDELGQQFCSNVSNRSNTWCTCYNATRDITFCEENPLLPGCVEVMAWKDSMSVLDDASKSLLLQQRHCQVCRDSGNPNQFVSSRALDACENDYQICSIQGNYGRATNPQFNATCNNTSNTSYRNTTTTSNTSSTSTTSGTTGDADDDADDDVDDDTDDDADDDDEEEDGIPWWVWLIVVIVVLMIVIGAIVITRR